MIFQDRAYSVLVVSSTERFSRSLSSLLPETEYYPIHFSTSAAAAKRVLLDRSYDLVLINTPLSDDFGTKLAIDVCSEKGAVALLFVKNELYSEIYSKTVDYGVFTVPKPTSSQMVSQALNWMCATRERLRRMEKKTLSIQEKMEEIRLVNRAKWMLIDRLKMTEEAAHHYIEKQAMDRCVTRREIAENIIKTYR